MKNQNELGIEEELGMNIKDYSFINNYDESIGFIEMNEGLAFHKDMDLVVDRLNKSYVDEAIEGKGWEDWEYDLEGHKYNLKYKEDLKGYIE
jgi:hypothetical protein